MSQEQRTAQRAVEKKLAEKKLAVEALQEEQIARKLEQTRAFIQQLLRTVTIENEEPPEMASISPNGVTFSLRELGKIEPTVLSEASALAAMSLHEEHDVPWVQAFGIAYVYFFADKFNPEDLATVLNRLNPNMSLLDVIETIVDASGDKIVWSKGTRRWWTLNRRGRRR